MTPRPTDPDDFLVPACGCHASADMDFATGLLLCVKCGKAYKPAIREPE